MVWLVHTVRHMKLTLETMTNLCIIKHGVSDGRFFT